MTETYPRADAEAPSATARAAGYAIAAAVVVLFAFYGTYFAHTLVPLAPEDVVRGIRATDAVNPYVWLLQGWQVVAGDTLVAARAFSICVSVLAIVVAFSIARRLTGHIVMAAALLLPFILFPPLVATLSLALPHALVVLAALITMRLMMAQAGIFITVLAGVVVFATALMHPLGPVVVPLWVIICATVLNQYRRALILLCFAAAAAAARVGVEPPIMDPDLSADAHGTVLTALVLPYGMAVITTLLSAMALCSGQVRDGLRTQAAFAAILGPMVALLVVIGAMLTGAVSAGQWVTEAAILFPLLFLAPWPLIYWVLRVMPQVKSLVAWIAFPVIMYSCFWVILGPVDPGRFPYSHRAAAPATAQ
jgi:hypothetical protein